VNDATDPACEETVAPEPDLFPVEAVDEAEAGATYAAVMADPGYWPVRVE